MARSSAFVAGGALFARGKLFHLQSKSPGSAKAVMAPSVMLSGGGLFARWRCYVFERSSNGWPGAPRLFLEVRCLLVDTARLAAQVAGVCNIGNGAIGDAERRCAVCSLQA